MGASFELPALPSQPDPPADGDCCDSDPTCKKCPRNEYSSVDADHSVLRRAYCALQKLFDGESTAAEQLTAIQIYRDALEKYRQQAASWGESKTELEMAIAAVRVFTQTIERSWELYYEQAFHENRAYFIAAELRNSVYWEGILNLELPPAPEQSTYTGNERDPMSGLYPAQQYNKDRDIYRKLSRQHHIALEILKNAETPDDIFAAIWMQIEAREHYIQQMQLLGKESPEMQSVIELLKAYWEKRIEQWVDYDQNRRKGLHISQQGKISPPLLHRYPNDDECCHQACNDSCTFTVFRTVQLEYEEVEKAYEEIQRQKERDCTSAEMERVVQGYLKARVQYLIFNWNLEQTKEKKGKK